MRKWRLISGCVVMGLAQLGTMASCQVSPMDGDKVPAGGAGGSGGGTGGIPIGPSCDDALGMGGECGICRVGVDEYCAEHDCAMAEYLDVCFHSTRRQMYSGCGYRKVIQLDAGSSRTPRVVDIWHSTTGELVYHSEQPLDGESCITIVGEEPECDEYGGDECYREPCFECLSGCAANMGCLLPGEPFTSCEARAAAVCGSGGAGGEGGQGGFGGDAP